MIINGLGTYKLMSISIRKRRDLCGKMLDLKKGL